MRNDRKQLEMSENDSNNDNDNDDYDVKSNGMAKCQI